MGRLEDMAASPGTAVSATTPFPVRTQHRASPHIHTQADDFSLRRCLLAACIPEPSIVPASVCGSAPTARDLEVIVTDMDTAAVGVMDIPTWAAESIHIGGGIPIPPTTKTNKIRWAWPTR